MLAIKKLPTHAPAKTTETPTIAPPKSPPTHPLIPFYYAPIIGAATAVVTPAITPFPIYYNPEEMPPIAFVGCFVEKNEFLFPNNFC